MDSSQGIQSMQPVLCSILYLITYFQRNGPNYEWPRAKSICERLITSSANFYLELVYGCAGKCIST